MKLLKIGKIGLVYFIVSLLGTGIFLSQAFADYPTKPITFVVGFAPGGGNGLAAQVLQAYFAKKFKQQINIVYKPGGSSVPAVLDVHTAKPDGYTLLIDASSSSSLQDVILKSLPYKVEERTFVVNCIVSPVAYFTSVTKPWKTLKEIAEFAKREPENLKWAAMGNSSLSTFNTYLMLDAMGLDIPRTKRIDLKNGPELLASAAGGHVHFGSF